MPLLGPMVEWVKARLTSWTPAVTELHKEGSLLTPGNMTNFPQGQAAQEKKHFHVTLVCVPV